MKTAPSEISAFENYKSKKVNGVTANKKLKRLQNPSKINKAKTKFTKKEEIKHLIEEEKKRLLVTYKRQVKKDKKVKKDVKSSVQIVDHQKHLQEGSKVKSEKNDTVEIKHLGKLNNLNHEENGFDDGIEMESVEKKNQLESDKVESLTVKVEVVSDESLNEKSVMKQNRKKSIKNLDNTSPKSENLLTPIKVKKNNSAGLDLSRIEMEVSVKDNKRPKKKLNKTTKGNSTVKANYSDSAVKGREILAWILAPMEVDTFLNEKWESKPFYVSRNYPGYYKTFISVQQIDQLLRNNELHYGRNIDITSYTNGVRETHNLVGRAHPAVVWDYYSNGCSVRLLNPQSYLRKLHSFSALLQEFFGCFVGANAYLTPPNSQGFAPHYDDIEAFVLQVEGEKLWKLYAPRSQSEVLPRFSSGNFKEEDLSECIMEVTLKPGDLLYFPRGVIHQGRTVSDMHSLHITLSVYQKNSWADLLEKLVPAALKIAIEENLEFRKALPINYSSCMGVVHCESNTAERTQFIEKVQSLFGKLFTYAPIDAAVDQLCKQFQHDALPPVLFPKEKPCTVFEGGPQIAEDGNVVNHIEIELDTKVRLLRRHILRLVVEEDTVKIYHSVYNSKIYHELEQQYLEIDQKMAPAVEMLIHSYPTFVSVDALPLENVELKTQLATDLWEAGLLITEEPLSETE